MSKVIFRLSSENDCRVGLESTVGICRRNAGSIEAGVTGKLFTLFLTKRRGTTLGVAALLTALIAFLEWQVELNISMGALYLFPMLMVGGHLAVWQNAAFAAFCVFLNEQLDPFPWTAGSGIPRLILT